MDLVRLHVRATDLRPQGRRLRLALADGTSRAVDAAVLAPGHGAPSTSWAPEALRRSSRFVADPWRDPSEPFVARGSDVVLVGAGLTMGDMAVRWGRDGVRVHVVSRHGMLPLAHAAAPLPPAPVAPAAAAPQTLTEARRFVFDAPAQGSGLRR